MKINENYRLFYDLDEIVIQKRNENGLWKDFSPINETAAMVWEGLERNVPEALLVTRICDEFDGAAQEQVRADLAALVAQLRQAGILSED